MESRRFSDPRLRSSFNLLMDSWDPGSRQVEYGRVRSHRAFRKGTHYCLLPWSENIRHGQTEQRRKEKKTENQTSKPSPIIEKANRLALDFTYTSVCLKWPLNCNLKCGKILSARSSSLSLVIVIERKRGREILDLYIIIQTANYTTYICLVPFLHFPQSY